MVDTLKVTREDVIESMKEVYDPEIPLNVVDLGLVYEVNVNTDNSVLVMMTLTSPGCGMGPLIVQDAKGRIAEIDGIGEIEVEMVFDPPWNPEMITEDGKMLLGME